MKYGEYIERVRENLRPEFMPEDFVNYEYLKNLACQADASFSKAWEKELVRVAGKVKVMWIADASPDVVRKIESFKAIHREAFRKLAKAFDKASSAAPENGWAPQQDLLLRMVDCVFTVSQPQPVTDLQLSEDETLLFKERADSRNTDEDQSDLPPYVIGVKLEGALDDANPNGSSPSKRERRTSWIDSNSAEGKTLSAIVGMAVFYAIVACQPLLSNATKTGDTFAYMESTAIIAESALSVLVGMAASRRLVRPRDLLRYTPVGLIRGAGDILELVCLNYVDPSLFTALSQGRLVLTGFATKCILRKPLNRIQWQGMSCISLGLVGFSMSYAVPGGGKVWGMLLVLASVICKVFASVYMDWILKKDNDVSVAYQSAAISCSSILAGVINIAAFDRERLAAGPLSGWNVLVGALVLMMLAKNLLSNVVVKKFSAITKYVIYAGAVAATYILQIISYGQPAEVLPMLFITIIFLGCITFADGQNWSLQETPK